MYAYAGMSGEAKDGLIHRWTKYNVWLDRESLSYWNHDNRYVVETGEYEVQIGASSADIRQTVMFNVK